MKILFVNYGGYGGCSGVHIHFLAQTLTGMGHKCYVFLPYMDNAQSYFGRTDYSLLHISKLSQLSVDFFAGAVLHAWTPREVPRLVVKWLQEKVDIPYYVHLEDNEIEIVAKKMGKATLEEQKQLALTQPELFIQHEGVHPLYFEDFLKNARGVTCIIKKLEEFVPAGVPALTFWPACEDAFYATPLQRNAEAREALGLAENVTVLAYPGAIHRNNVEAFTELLFALEALSQEGHAVKLLRMGIEYLYNDQTVADLYNKHVLYIQLPGSSMLPSVMGLADILVQPGAPGAFDDYRFPSKIPFFLASGRPVILPATNVAEALRHGQDCFLLQKGTATEIAHYIRLLITHPDVAQSMGLQGRASARRLFNWKASAQKLVAFYEATLAR